MTLKLQYFSHQTLIAISLCLVPFIVNCKLYNNNIRILFSLSYISVKTNHSKLGRSSADPRLHKMHVLLSSCNIKKATKGFVCITLRIYRGCSSTLRNGTTYICHCNLFPFFCTGNCLTKAMNISTLDQRFLYHLLIGLRGHIHILLFYTFWCFISIVQIQSNACSCKLFWRIQYNLYLSRYMIVLLPICI